MNKKIISTILAGACALSAMSFSAFADLTSLEGSKTTYSLSALVEYPTLDVTVPATEDVAVALNPFGLTFGFNAAGKYMGKNSTEAADTANQLATATTAIVAGDYKIQNYGVGAVDVSFTISGTVAGEAKLVEAAPAANSTTKDVYLFVKASTTAIKENATALADSDKGLVVTTKEQTATLLTVPVPTNATTPGAGYFTFGGTLNKGTTDAPLKTAWTAKDGVKVKLILDLSPAMA